MQEDGPHPRAIFPSIYVIYVCLALIVGRGSPATASEPEPGVRFPATLTDIDGRVLDIEQLASDHHLVVVTLKAPWCPVCQKQLVRIRERLPDLTACGVTFLVLSPGTPEELAGIRKRTGFDFPFVADQGLRVARAVGIAMTEDQILPCMLQILPGREIGWRQMGRNGAYFGDRELSEYFDCTRFV